jgi:CheY-like chemotaxis protein
MEASNPAPRSRGLLDATEQGTVSPVEPRLDGSETILFVEDEQLVRTLVSEMLEDAGYRVLVAANGDEALAAAAVHDGAIDLLLTDVVMPGLSGQQVAERLVQILPELPVLFTSGYKVEAIEQHGVLGPGTAFLEKPFGAQQLTRKLRELLDRPARS